MPFIVRILQSADGGCRSANPFRQLSLAEADLGAEVINLPCNLSIEEFLLECLDEFLVVPNLAAVVKELHRGRPEFPLLILSFTYHLHIIMELLPTRARESGFLRLPTAQITT